MIDPLDDCLPHHIYMSLWTDEELAGIAGIFASSGWSSRTCSWTDYEVELENKAELVIESENPILVHGPIDSATETVPLIREVLDDAGITYTFEAYNDQDEIVVALTEDELNAKDGDHT